MISLFCGALLQSIYRAAVDTVLHLLSLVVAADAVLLHWSFLPVRTTVSSGSRPSLFPVESRKSYSLFGCASCLLYVFVVKKQITCSLSNTSATATPAASFRSHVRPQPSKAHDCCCHLQHTAQAVCSQNGPQLCVFASLEDFRGACVWHFGGDLAAKCLKKLQQ